MQSAWVVLPLVLVAVSGCLSVDPLADDGHDHVHSAPDQAEEVMAHDHMHQHDMVYGQTPGDHIGQPGMQRSDFGPAEGTIPDADAARDLPQLPRIRIIGDVGFNPANGVRGGNGTLDDPFVISGWYITGEVTLQDTEACVVVKENYIAGQLSLNWNGQCLHVHHNTINDLRVNENIRRTGFATGGWIEQNDIGFVGQLRHYDGVFRLNEVGPRPDTAPFDPVMETTPLLAPDLLVANIDGFNQGIISFNTFHGSVDLDFHGHHHGSGFFSPHSHYHGDNETHQAHHVHDHTQRWTSVAFTDNTVIDPDGYGLRFEDRNHAGDDRTANSEREETLKEPHRHFTHVTLARNTIEGAGIWVDVFNADDKLHEWVNPGWLDIHDNKVRLVERTGGLPLGLFGPAFAPHSAIQVITAKEVELDIRGNDLSWKSAERGLFDEEPQPIGIDLRSFKASNITVMDNDGEAFVYGVHALRFDEDTWWTLAGNTFPDAAWEVYYDETVAHRPHGG